MDLKSSTYPKDILSGLVASFFVSPTNAILDRSVIEFANGKATVKDGVRNGFRRLFTQPVEFFTSYKFRWMYFVYAMTYCVNNLTDQVSYIPDLPIPIQNLLATFVANTICGIAKDKAYAQHFGAAAASHFPVRSLFLFFLRDIITVASAFTFPPILGKWIQKQTDYSERTSKMIAQLACPLLIQIVSTPLHLLGLDIYNRKGEGLASRARLIAKLYPAATGMRMIRFLPAYGIGGVINTELRRALK